MITFLAFVAFIICLICAFILGARFGSWVAVQHAIKVIDEALGNKK